MFAGHQLVCLNIDAEVEELRFPHSQKRFDRNQKRLWATLCFRLGMKLTQLGLSVIHVHYSSDKFKQLLQSFKREASHTDTTEALKKCIQLCEVYLKCPCDVDNNAVMLILGVREEMMEKFERQVSNIVVINNLFTSSLQHLLTINDTNFGVYIYGRVRMVRCLEQHFDYLSQTPLEAAYNWSLSCSSALNKELLFLCHEDSFKFECKELLPGRLFPQTDSSEYDKSFPAVKHDVMYYVEERDDHHTHPLADMFFAPSLCLLILLEGMTVL